MYVIHIQLRIYWYTYLCPWFLLLSESLISTACLIIHHHSIILSSILLQLPCDFGRFWASLASQLVGKMHHPSLGHRSPNIIPLPLIHSSCQEALRHVRPRYVIDVVGQIPPHAVQRARYDSAGRPRFRKATNYPRFVVLMGWNPPAADT